MFRCAFLFAVLAMPVVLPVAAVAQNQFDPAIFKSPPAEFRGHAMWNFNLTTLNEKAVLTGIQEMAKLNYGGFFIEASAGPTTGLSEAYLKMFRRPQNSQGVVFLSDEFFRIYKIALEEAKRLGLNVLLYDDYSFPTGTVAGQLYSKYPQHVAKIIEMAEKDVIGPAKAELAVPQGIYIGAVLMNRDTHELIDVSNARQQDRIVRQVAKGNWKLMVFYLAEGRARIVDYLDESAMDVFISMTYEKYNQNFGNYFGSLIKRTFYDEPSMHHAEGRMWTPGFNAKFQKRYGYSPMKYYPALWYDIGPQTAAARVALFGFRGQLFAENFIKKLNDWCAAHKLDFGGHLDQEEPVNPTPLNGDLIKVFEHQAVPVVDDIWWWGRSNPAYKIVTSSGFNYDKPVVGAETYAAYRVLNEKIAYQVAMDQYAMGINFQVPARTVQPRRAEVNDYVGRMSYLLQRGRHVADVAVLYPIASLQAQYHHLGGRQFERGPNEQAPQIFEVAYAREGGFAAGIDYQDLGEALFRCLRVDYTYLHPEVFVNRTTIDGSRLILNNRENREEYRVLFVPGGEVLPVAVAAKIREFYDKGGMVIATSNLPRRSAEFGKDKEVQQAIAAVFGVAADGSVKADVRRAQDRQNFWVFWYYARKNQAGGQAIFIPNSQPWLVDFALRQMLPLRDVDIQEPIGMLKRGPDYDGALTYIHKVKNDRDIYFFANSSPKNIDTKAVLRGHKTLRIWNPHTGTQEAAEFTHAEQSGEPVTTLRLVLPSVSSLFFIQE
jgi:hypothetical protein